MTKDSNKNDGPSCACGKVDLYEESLRLKKLEQDAQKKSKELEEKEEEDSTTQK